MKIFCRFYRRVSVRRSDRRLQTPQRRASQSEAATLIAQRKEGA